MCIFSPTAYKAKGEEGLGSNIIGTGPSSRRIYEGRLRAVQAQRQVLAERQALSRQHPYPVRADVTTRLAMLESGDVDHAAGIPNFDVPRLAKDKSIALRTIPSLQQHYVVINNLVKPLDDPRVRQALNYATDKAGIVKSVFAGSGATLSKAPTLSPGLVTIDNDGVSKLDIVILPRPAKARALLARGATRIAMATASSRTPRASAVVTTAA
jgi:hypothetical protein